LNLDTDNIIAVSLCIKT